MRAGQCLACIFSVALAALSICGGASAADSPQQRVSPKRAVAAGKVVTPGVAKRGPAKMAGPVAQRVKAASLTTGKSSRRVSSRLGARGAARSAAIAKVERATARMPKRENVLAFRVPEPEVDHEGMPLLKSSAFMVQDVQSGKILLEKNASVAQPIASITKLMTAMVVLDAHQNLAETLEITDGDLDLLKGTSSRLAVGTRLTREELLILALMSSENRAASALARNYPGGQAAFIEAMNVKTRMMGMNDTRFFDSSGLNKNNVSSARDLAILVANASRYPLVREFSTRQEYSATLHGGRVHTFHNTNALVKDSDWQIDVQKTGYINESGKCLVMQAWVSNKQVAIVLLDSWGRYTRIGDANRVRKWVETSMSRQDLASLHKGGVRTAAN